MIRLPGLLESQIPWVATRRVGRSRERHRHQPEGDSHQADPLRRSEPLTQRTTATMTATAGPNELARPTIRVGATSRPIAKATKPTMSTTPATPAAEDEPASTTAPTSRGARPRGAACNRDDREDRPDRGRIRDPGGDEDRQPARRLNRGRHADRQHREQQHRHDREQHAAADEAVSPASHPRTRGPVRITPSVASAPLPPERRSATRLGRQPTGRRSGRHMRRQPGLRPPGGRSQGGKEREVGAGRDDANPAEATRTAGSIRDLTPRAMATR